MPKFSGIVRVLKSQAKLETPRGLFILNPYPADAPLSRKSMFEMGRDLFGYLDGQKITVWGILADDLLYGAHLITSDAPIEDVQIAPESKDPFARDIEQYFQKDAKEIAIKLNDLGIRTISALYHRIRNNMPEELELFSRYLRVQKGRIEEFLRGLESATSNEALVRASPRFPVKHGINWTSLMKTLGKQEKKPAATPPKFPVHAVTPNLPSSVDLVPHATAVKNQGMRGTCVAHTAIVCLEGEYIREGKANSKLNLSEQYLYWACKNIDGAPNDEGTFLEYAVDVLLNGVPKEPLVGGVCTERQWPYKKEPKKNDESQGPPTPAARKALAKNPAKFRALKYGRVKHNSIKAIKEALAHGHCVGLSVYTYHFWTDDFAWREGIISLPLGLKPDGAHAICLVGYKDDDAQHRDGYFLFKNSWDTTWGYGRPDPGFGSLPYRYVLKEAIEAYTVEI